MLIRLQALLAVVTVLCLASCGREKTDKPKQAEPAPALQLDSLEQPKQLPAYTVARWQAKVAADLGSEVPVDSGMDRRAFLEAAMQGPGFEQALLGFNLYFLGRYTGRVVGYDGALLSDVLRFPQAVASVKSLAAGGDPMSFFEFKQPLYVDTPRDPSLFEVDDDGNFIDRTPAETRAVVRNRFLDQAQQVQALIDEDADKDTLCAAIFSSDGSLDDFIGSYGLPESLSGQIGFFQGPGSEFLAWCFLPDYPSIDVGATLAALKSSHLSLMDLTDQLVEEGYAPRQLADYKTVNAADYGLDQPTAFTQGFFQDLPNSSTNFNRRRAAYVLKRYFCDDLTPINQVMPESHGSDQHAADPGCQSCHYKLDPLAGFFRNHGFSGSDFSSLPIIFFDDGAQFDRETYVEEWQGDGDSDWNIGYIRSATDASANSYGESPADLFEIIRQAPESKMCMIERMFDYFVDEEQTIDPGFVSYLAKTHTDEASSMDPATAYRRLLKRVLLSESYSHQDREQDVCYDYAPGAQTNDKTPCQISFIVQENCASCHTGESAQGGLDLAVWQPGPDGVPWFKHQGPEGLYDAESSRKIILDRLTTSDPNLRMPLDRDMGAQDAETLFLWFSADEN